MQLGNVVHGYGGPDVALLDTGLQTQTALTLAPAGFSCNKFVWDPVQPDFRQGFSTLHCRASCPCFKHL